MVDKEKSVVNQTAEAIEEAGGVEMPDGETQTPSGDQDDNQGSEESSTPETESQTATEGESQTTETQSEDQEPQRLDQHPRFREVISQNRELKNQLKEMQSVTEQLKGQFEAMQRMGSQPKQASQELTQEQQMAKQQLMEVLGLQGLPDTVNQLKEQISGFTKSQTENAFKTEEKTLLENIDKFKVLNPGETPDDVLDKLQDHIDKHPILSGMRDKPGVWTLAFNDLYISQASELGKRSAGSQLIKEQQKAKAANMENSIPAGTKGGIKKTGNIFHDMQAALKAAGGEDNIDFDA